MMTEQVSLTTYSECAIYLAVITVFGILANMIVLFTVILDGKLFTPKNLVLVNLAAADSGIAFFGNPIALYNALMRGWSFDKEACILYGFFMSLFGTSSIYTLTLLAYQRYLIICYPFSGTNGYKITWSNTRFWIYGIWLCSFLISVPPLFGWGSYEEEAAGISCSVNWSHKKSDATNYSIYLPLVVFGVPFCFISFSYLKILVTLKRINRRMTYNQTRKRARGRETKVARMIFLMVAVFFAAWAPYSVYLMLITFTNMKLDGLMTIAPSLFARSSVCYNPIIYFFSNAQFRESLFRHLGIRIKTENQRPNIVSMSRIETLQDCNVMTAQIQNKPTPL